MVNSVLVDNDIVLKVCCYNASKVFLECLGAHVRSVCVLGMIQFVLTGVIRKRNGISNKLRTSTCLDEMLSIVVPIEPSDNELKIAAELEEVAQRNDVELDAGESQLLAMLISQRGDVLITGDKRAIRGIDAVTSELAVESAVEGRIACLEQVAMSILQRTGAEHLHSLVCSESGVDTALEICCSCATKEFSEESIGQKLASYIGELRRFAPKCLVVSNDLSAVIP